MANVINDDNKQQHNIDKYSFKILTVGSEKLNKDEEASSDLVNSQDVEIQEPSALLEDDEIVDTSAMSKNSKDSLIESLLKKTDEMSSNFIKLQMKLESMTDEHKVELLKVKEDSFAEGVEAGKEQAAREEKTNIANGLSQFSNSVTTLENSAKEFEDALEGIKKELIIAALDISKEVINIELNSNSSEVATVLSNELIKELQSASKVILKVNPLNHGVISQGVGSLKHVEIISDNAVSQGGVIAISDAGNIDAQISKRFERVKRAALSE
ncbi:MAG: flagellar assembly protein FliH [Sulfurimonas sp.]|nr:flagellar assembly protein FliH [Sulfurimonas sp.]